MYMRLIMDIINHSTIQTCHFGFSTVNHYYSLFCVSAYVCDPLTRKDSWNEEAWYCAYLMMVVWERLLSQRHIFLLPLGSQFSSVG